ncbi:hypothetical protein GGR23_003371 [Gellertiella hungarica]|uniref:Uncharacterized protein n=1 Tax=Gellertiella hungarica TaxID=1572859 RepID=A0A7W6NLP4_9HYPH|nr:hypothetical protein [Gellertiella hungarica]
MTHVPSELRVTTEPSGRVVLVDETALASAVPDVLLEPAEAEEPELDVAEWVPPPVVVDALTWPPPAVTREDNPGPAEFSLSITVQRVPSSSVSVSSATAAPAAASASASVSTSADAGL